MYSRDDIEKIAADILRNQQNKSKDEILVQAFTNIAIVLDDKAEFYMSFGPFWWNIKRLFPKYLKDNNNWYCSSKFDQDSVERFSYCDDFLDYAASIYYSNQHNTDNKMVHFLPAENANEYEEYVLIDEDAPCSS